MNNQDILTFRLFGDNVSPSSFRAKDIAEIISNLEDSLISTLKEIDPTIKEEEAFISLFEVTDKSNGLNFRPNILQLVLAFQLLSTSITTNNFDNLPTKSILGLRELQSKIRKYNCNAQFQLNNKTLGELTRDTVIQISENQKIKGDTTIYGKIIRLGGKEPKVRLELLEGYTISIDITENITKEIAQYIYSVISLRGKAVWNRKDNHILDFKLEDIGKYREKSNMESFNELRKLLGNEWDKINNVEEYLLNN